MEEKYITTKELCDWLRISRSTATLWRKQGMPYFGKDRSLRYKKSEIEKWLNEQESKK
jgi:predicted DNA-binding transcriptional regulator AlpA